MVETTRALVAGNLFSQEQESSDTAAGWSANGTNTTLSFDSTRTRSGTGGSTKMVATAAGNVQQRTGFGTAPACPADTNLHVYTHVFAAGGWGVSVLFNWIDSAGNLISQANTTATGTTTDNTWNLWTSPTVKSPVGTVRCQVIITVTGLDAAEACWTDDRFFGPPPGINVSGSAGLLSPPVLGRGSIIVGGGDLRFGAEEVKLAVGSKGIIRAYHGTKIIYGPSPTSSTSEYTIEDSHRGVSSYQVEYSAGWKKGMFDHYTNTIGDTATIRFKGVRIRVYGVKDLNAGVATFSLDGLAKSKDLYAPERTELQLLYDSGPVTDADHVLVISCTGDRNELSSGHFINIDNATVTVVGPLPVVDNSVGGNLINRPSIQKQPFRGSWKPGAAAGTWSIWNTPLGDAAEVVPASLIYPTENDGKVYQDRVHFGYAGNPVKIFSARLVDPDTGAFYERREPWKSGGTARVHVTPGDTGPGAYKGGNHLCAFPLENDDTRMWHGHPLGLVDGGDPAVRYVDPHDRPVDLYGQGHRGAHGGSHMSGIGGCIRQWEMDSPNVDAINHAIEININGPNMFYGDPTFGKVWPANSTDSYARTGYKGTNKYLMMGSLLRLPVGFDWLAATTDLNARKILRAATLYGVYVVDDAKWNVFQLSVERTFSLSAQPLATFHTPIIEAFMKFQIVINNSPTSVGGGGNPIGPLVPDVTRPVTS